MNVDITTWAFQQLFMFCISFEWSCWFYAITRKRNDFMLMIDSAKYEWRLWYLWIWIFCSIRVQLCICTLLIDKDKPYVRVLTFWLYHVYILFAVLFVFYACYIMTIGRFLSYFSLLYSFYHYNDVIVSAMTSQITRLSRRRSKKTSKLRVTGLCAENSHIWQSLSLHDWRWKAAVTLGWMGATFSGSGSRPHEVPPSPPGRWEYRWCGKFAWIAAL